MSLSKSEVVFIGDQLEYDIASAQNAGITAIWYNRKNRLSKEIIPDYEFSEWQKIDFFKHSQMGKK